jgi:hypothetical protein
VGAWCSGTCCILGEINSSQKLAWRRSIEVLDAGGEGPRTLALFPEDHCEAALPDESVVRLRLSHLRLGRPRQSGGCWLALQLWRELELDEFSEQRFPPSRKGTRWDEVLLILTVYRTSEEMKAVLAAPDVSRWADRRDRVMFALLYTTLTKFTEAGHLAARNNFSERLMRTIVVGRKTFLFVGSEGARHAAAIYYSPVGVV